MPDTLPTEDELFGAAPQAQPPTEDELFGPVPAAQPKPMEGAAADALFRMSPLKDIMALVRAPEAVSNPNVLDAAAQGAKEGWNSTPPEFSALTDRLLRSSGILDAKPDDNILVRSAKAFNAGVLRPLAVGIAAVPDVFLQTGNAAWGAVTHGLYQEGENLEGKGTVGPLHELAAMAEWKASDLAAHGAIPHPAEPAAMPLLRQAEDAKVFRGEAEYMGTAPETPPEPMPEPPHAAPADASTGREPGSAAAAPEALSVEGVPGTAPDIHAVARQIAPEVFSQYDPLLAQQETFRRWLDELDAERRQAAEASPEAAALQDQIGTILGKVGGVEDRLTRSQAARLDEARARLDGVLNPVGDSPDMARVRQALMQTDYRMRDMAPDVSAAYSEAAARMPAPEEEPPAAAPEPGDGVAQPEAAPDAGAPEGGAPEAGVPDGEQALAPEKVAAPEQVAAIAEDVTRKLVEAGEPEERAQAAGALWAARFATRASLFEGARGTALDLYRAEAPEIRKGPQAPETGELELAQEEAQPVATLTGEEIAPRAAELSDLRDAARQWYDVNLRNRSFVNLGSGKEIEFRGSRKSFSASANPDKLRLFAALPDLIRNGRLGDPIAPVGKQRNVKAFYRLDGPVSLGGRDVQVSVLIREDNNGHLYYNHGIVEGEAPSPGTETPRSEAAPGTGGSGASYDQSIGPAADGVNMTLGQSKRGTILLRPGRRSIISLVADANASTFLHEIGHEWLEQMSRDATHAAAPAQLRADMNAVRAWLGARDGQSITRAMHEKFARGFERYLMEGRAPSAALARVFGQFRQWLTDVYRTVARLKAPITDDIRDVFDRLIAVKPERQAVIAPDLEPAAHLADIHEAAAATTPVPQAHAGANIVRGEIKATVKRDVPEKEDAVFAGTADQPGRRPPDRAQPDGIGDGSQPDAGQAGGHPHPGALGAGRGGTTPEGAGLAPRPKRARSDLFERVAGEPRRLAEYLRRKGGLRDEGGEIAGILGGRKRPGLVNGRGMTLDDAALAAWEDGYFPGHAERPGPRDLLDALRDDLNGNPRYSHLDEDRLEAWRGATERNAEIRQLDDKYGITRAEFFERVRQAVSEERQADEVKSRDEAVEADMAEAEDRAREWLDSRGDAWEPDAEDQSAPRSLEDLEREKDLEEAARRGASTPPVKGGETEPPAGQNERFAPSAADPVDKAGNIRLDLLNSPDDVADVIRRVCAENGEFQNVRGPVTDGQVIDLAEAMGMDPSYLNSRKLGEAWTAPQIVALRRLLIKSATAVRDAMVKAANGGEDEVLAYAEAKARHLMIQERVSSVTAEAGRALRAFQSQFMGGEDPKALGEFLKENTGRTLFQLKREAELGSKLKTPAQVAAFVEASKKASFPRMVLEFYINALISGPITHLRYLDGNALTALWKAMAETPAAAAIGAVREAVAGKPVERIYFGEAGAQLHGMITGSRKGWQALGEAFNSGVTVPLPGEEVPAHFMTPQTAIPGRAGEIIRIPGRTVTAIHSFTRFVGYEQVIHSLAYRRAMAEGLEGRAFADRVSELATNPTEGMMEEAVRDATSQVYMRSPEFNSAFGALNRAINSSLLAKFMVPFMRIGGNITRGAFIDRSVLGLLSADVRDTLAGNKGAVARDMQIGKMAVGTALAAVTAGLAAEGLITGGGPTDPKQHAGWIAAGNRPYSLRIGDWWVSYDRLGSLSMLMKLAADMHDTAAQWDDLEGTKLAGAFFENISKDVLDENWMRGVKDALDAVYHPEEYGRRYVAGLATNFIPFSSGMGQVAREIDPSQREARSILDAARSKVPWLSEGLFPRRDRWGEPIPNAGAISQAAGTPLDRELYELGVYPAQPGRQIRGVDLTDRQYDDYARLSGRLARMQVSAMLSRPGWSGLPEGVRREAVTKVIAAARRQAQTAVMMGSVGSANDIVRQAVENKRAALE